MTAHIAIRPSSTTELPQRSGSHAKDIEPAWFSRLLARKSRKSQYLSVLDLETASTYHATEPILPLTTSLLSEDIPDNNVDTSSPRPSAPMATTVPRNDKTKTKSKRRFSFTPRREEATPTAKPADNTQARRKRSGAAYVPKHAASDFGQVAVPTTYRDNVVFLYSSSSSSDHQQHRRSSRVGSNSATAMAEYQRRRSSAISNPPVLDGSTVSLDTAPMPANAWSHRGSNVSQRRPSTNNLLSCQSLVFMMTEEDGEGDNSAITDVNDDIKEEGECDTLIVLCEENPRKMRQNSVLTVPEAPSVNDDAKLIASRSKRHSTLGHNLQVSPPTIVLNSSASSITSKRAQRGSFSQARRTSRRESTGEAINSETKEPKKGRRDSVMVSLGKRVSEYIKPTIVPDNETTVLPQISVSRSRL
ncbi:hypothetical protein Sste5346_004356 [Sporothrix stenoceras]|uniref:Uncharacterized protein n=1 Tax=Sporothrix stenoceras TaxID=5173 RepID=A0ABR3Z920_9PEZI